MICRSILLHFGGQYSRFGYQTPCFLWKQEKRSCACELDVWVHVSVPLYKGRHALFSSMQRRRSIRLIERADVLSISLKNLSVNFLASRTLDRNEESQRASLERQSEQCAVLSSNARVRLFVVVLVECRSRPPNCQACLTCLTRVSFQRWCCGEGKISSGHFPNFKGFFWDFLSPRKKKR